MQDSEIHWVANEGVRVSVICKDLSGVQVKPAYQPALAKLIITFGENFARLPAVTSQSEKTTMDQSNLKNLALPAGISITSCEV